MFMYSNVIHARGNIILLIQQRAMLCQGTEIVKLNCSQDINTIDGIILMNKGCSGGLWFAGGVGVVTGPGCRPRPPAGGPHPSPQPIAASLSESSLDSPSDLQGKCTDTHSR